MDNSTVARRASDREFMASQIGSFANAAEGASLELHNQVERTVDALCAKSRLLCGLGDLGASFVSALNAVPVRTGEYIDANDTLIAGLDSVADGFESALPILTLKKGAIDKDDRLHDSHCDMLHSAYDDMLNAVARLSEIAKDLRAAIIRHDLAAEPRDGDSHGSGESLIASLRHAS